MGVWGEILIRVWIVLESEIDSISMRRVEGECRVRNVVERVWERKGFLIV